MHTFEPSLDALDDEAIYFDELTIFIKEEMEKTVKYASMCREIGRDNVDIRIHVATNSFLDDISGVRDDYLVDADDSIDHKQSLDAWDYGIREVLEGMTMIDYMWELAIELTQVDLDEEC
tara:strand:+ start:92 stop:451 length:360 start_codon:yes stop_codon:yes gene_type:complete